MAFIDTAKVHVKAGKGGNGIVSFRHEKFIERGGPDGGNGGDGGDVIFYVDPNLNTLAHFRYKQDLFAENGKSGSKRKRHGKAGEDLRIGVPKGTVIKDGDELIADLIEDDDSKVIAQGGRGGYGNAHFKSSKRRSPKVAEKGEPGEEMELQLELKMLADIGLVGLPNAGKSTFLSVVTNAKPAVDDYPFTTLSPNLGVATIDEENLLIADIPGLIEGASKGKGLGDDFLRHIERTGVIIHFIDIYDEDVTDSYQVIIKELSEYEADLTKRAQIVALTKTEGLDKKSTDAVIKKLKTVTNSPVFAISSHSRKNVEELLRAAKDEVEKFRKQEEVAEEEEDDDEIPVITADSKDNWEVIKKKNRYIVKGEKINRFALRTDFDNEFGVMRLRDIMHKIGITKELESMGAKRGDRIVFDQAKEEFRY